MGGHMDSHGRHGGPWWPAVHARRHHDCGILWGVADDEDHHPAGANRHVDSRNHTKERRLRQF